MSVLATRPRLLIMAKAPIAGEVKTRLCPPCSPEDAARIARASLLDTFNAAAGAELYRDIHLAIEGDPADLLEGFEQFVVYSQHGDDFAQKLEQAWAAFPGPCVQIGMDTPQVTASLLDDAAVRLARPGVDAVLGLADDGGWWCLGVVRPCRGMFEGIEMSVSDTGARQLARLRELGMVVELLSELRDLDGAEDARAIARSHPDSLVARAVRSTTALAAASSGALG